MKYIILILVGLLLIQILTLGGIFALVFLIHGIWCIGDFLDEKVFHKDNHFL
jgi:hypothetical protein